MYVIFLSGISGVGDQEWAGGPLGNEVSHA